MSTPNNTIISAKGLTKEFRSRGNKNVFTGVFRPDWRQAVAVESVSISIKKGEAVAFLGPNGAGKTTTTKMLTGLVKPTDGKIDVLGFYPFDRDYTFLRRIGLVMGNKAGLNWDLSARQSYELLQKLYDIPMADYTKRVEELTQLLEVVHVLDAQVRRLSLGERMKLELIGAILHDPEILFLDEPTIGLDITAKRNVRKFLAYLHKQGKTLLLTSHDMDDVAEVCDRVIVINRGSVMYDGTMQSLNTQYSHSRYARVEFIDEVPSDEVAAQYGEVISRRGNIMVIAADKSQVMESIAKLARKYPIQDITIEQVPLEVVIEDLYKRTKTSGK